MRIVYYIILLTLSFTSYAQEYHWKEALFGQPNDGHSVNNQFVIDNEGNKIIIGRFKNSFTLLGETVYSNLPVGVFLAKLNQNDSLLWLQTIAEAEEINIQGASDVMANRYQINAESNGNVNVVLSFSDPIYIYDIGFIDDPDVATDFVWSSVVLKYYPNGQLFDHDILTGSCNKGIGSFYNVDNNLVFQIGTGKPSVTYPDTCSFTFLNNFFNVSNYGDSHILTFDENDSLINENIVSNSSFDRFIKVDGSIYLTASATSNGTISFDSTYFFPSVSSIDNRSFLAKYDNNGSIEWLSYFGNNGWDSHIVSYDVIKSADNIIIAGKSFTQSVSNQIFFPNAPTLNGSPWGGDDFFVVCYDTLGNVKWQSISNSPNGWEHITEITTDSNKNVYATGTFAAPLIFAGDTLIPFGAEDVFVLCYDSLGTEKWAINAAGTSLDQARSIGMAPNGDLYVSGSTFSSSATFGDITYSLSGDNAHLFLARLDTSSNSIGIHNINEKDGIIQLYPNPNTGSFVINSNKVAIMNIIVYNMLGNKVYSQSLNANQYKIELQHLPKGAFVVELELENGSIVQNKFVLQ